MYLDEIRKYPGRHVLLLLDLDGNPDRISQIGETIPIGISDRVFSLCCLNEAESIKNDLGHGKFEDIGKKLAESCYNSTYDDQSGSPWACSQLSHNRNELNRLATAVRPLLFSPDCL